MVHLVLPAPIAPELSKLRVLIHMREIGSSWNVNNLSSSLPALRPQRPVFEAPGKVTEATDPDEEIPWHQCSNRKIVRISDMSSAIAEAGHLPSTFDVANHCRRVERRLFARTLSVRVFHRIDVSLA